MTETIFVVDDIYRELDNIETLNESVSTFLDTFTIEQIKNRKNEKLNSVNVFKHNIIDNEIQSSIIKVLNRVNQNNIEKSAAEIKNINFTKMEDYQELVIQCLNKIKNTNEQMKYYIGLLFCNLICLFNNSDNKKVNIEDLLLKTTREEYLDFIKFDVKNNTDKNKKILIVISTLYEVKILDEKLISDIFDDFRNFIKYEPNKKNYEQIEIAIQYLCYFLSSLGFNNDLILKINNNNDKLKYMERLQEILILSKHINVFLKNEILLYDKNISKKMVLTVENTIEEVQKIEDLYAKIINI